MKIEKELLISPLRTFTPAESFTLISGGRVVTILFDSIVRIEKHGSTAIIHTTDNRYRTDRCMQQLLRDLPVNDFFRISTSHIVSLRQVTRFTKSHVHINGLRLSLTAYYRKQLLVDLRWLLQGNYEALHMQKKNSP